MTTITMTDALAGIIRQIDGDNTLSPTDLGEAIAMKLPPFYQTLRGRDLIAFVERTNPDKRLGASRLAELIVAEFDLDEES
jgi:hypothetical protein